MKFLYLLLQIIGILRNIFFLCCLVLSVLSLLPYFLVGFFINKLVQSGLKPLSCRWPKKTLLGIGVIGVLVILCFSFSLLTLGVCAGPDPDLEVKFIFLSVSPNPEWHKQITYPIIQSLDLYLTGVDQGFLKNQTVFDAEYWKTWINPGSHEIASQMNLYLENINQQARSLTGISWEEKINLRRAAQREIILYFYSKGATCKFFHGFFDKHLPNLPTWSLEYKADVGFYFIYVKDLLV